MIRVKRQPVTWSTEISPAAGEQWPPMRHGIGGYRWQLRPTRVSFTVDEADLISEPMFLDVRAGFRVRADGTDGAKLGTMVPHTVLVEDMPESVQKEVRVALSTIRGEAVNLRLISLSRAAQS